MNNQVGLAIAGAAMLLVVGCHKNPRSAAAFDVCANGACEATTTCEFAACHDEHAPTKTKVKESTITSHSPNAAVFNDRERATCPVAKSDLPPIETLVDDSDIPEYNRARTRRTNMGSGQEFLQDWELHEQLLHVQGAFFDCLDLAACYAQEPASTGELDFMFELEPDGRVSAVSVAPSEELDDPVVRACARRSVFQTRFTSWKGGRMVVSYNLEISLGTAH